MDDQSKIYADYTKEPVDFFQVSKNWKEKEKNRNLIISEKSVFQSVWLLLLTDSTHYNINNLNILNVLYT